MTVVIQSSSPSSSSCSSSIHCGGVTGSSGSPIRSPTLDTGSNDGLYQQSSVHLNLTSSLINNPNLLPPPAASLEPVPLQHQLLNFESEQEGGRGERKRSRREREGGVVVAVRGGGGGGGGEEEEEEGGFDNQWSVLALFASHFRKSVFGCSHLCQNNSSIRISSSSCSYNSGPEMEIGVPTNVRHVAHVTFDRFNGFLGLPVEFEPEVPRRAPSASTTVFGVSTNSMQLSFDSRGNSVPTILLMMQRRLYALGGLEVEGIFRITAGNAQEEYVKEQLNRGVVPEDADVHCLAGLIKTWFRELPTGLLDCLSPELLMQSQTEDECAELARHLPSTEAALLDWAVNLMADIAQFEHLNKMNARNVAVVFAPNMTHVLDPLTALMHAVQVMNFLKTLIARTLREREDAALDLPPSDQDSSKDPWDENDPRSPLQTILEEYNGTEYEEDTYYQDSVPREPDPQTNLPCLTNDDDYDDSSRGIQHQSPAFLASIENVIPRCSDEYYSSFASVPRGGGGTHDGDDGGGSSTTRSQRAADADHTAGPGTVVDKSRSVRAKNGQSSVKFVLEREQQRKVDDRDKRSVVQGAEKAKGTDIVNRMNARAERIEAWR